MRQLLESVRAGECDFGTFASLTRPRWLGMARRLLRKWDPRWGVSVDDVAQELLLAAWKFLPKWQEGRADIERFVVFNAHASARDWLHRQRGASSSSGATRRESLLPVFEVEELATEPMQERALALLYRMEELLAYAQSPQQIAAVRAVFRTGSVDGAAAELDGYMTRKKVHAALRAVERTVRSVA